MQSLRIKAFQGTTLMNLTLAHSVFFFPVLFHIKNRQNIKVNFLTILNLKNSL